MSVDFRNENLWKLFAVSKKTTSPWRVMSAGHECLSVVMSAGWVTLGVSAGHECWVSADYECC